MNYGKTITIATACLLSSAATIAQPLDTPPCTGSTRECLIQVGTIYLDGVVNHDASKIPFTDAVTRWDNAVKTATGSSQLRHSIETDLGAKAIKGYRDAHWFVEGNDLLVFYLMDVIVPYTHIFAGTTHLAEKFHIVKGRIDEIEAIFCNSPGSTPEEAKMDKKAPFVCGRSVI